MRIVTFHTESMRWFDDPHPLGGRKHPHTELVSLFAASVRETNPRASLELLTDHDSDVDRSIPFDRVWRSMVDQEALMLERLRAQRELLVSARPGELLVFLDADVLVRQDLRSVFEQNFHVGVTIRDQPVYEFERTMPYNNGVIFVRRDGGEAVVSYFECLVSALQSLGPETWAWSGNQFVVRDLLGTHPPGTVVKVGEALVRILPCSKYNYTPAKPNEDVTEKYILHFRGDAKDLMPAYAVRLEAMR